MKTANQANAFFLEKEKRVSVLRGYGAMCNMYVYWHGE
jgi:hypothetical protein